jgi:hypothetical protein
VLNFLPAHSVNTTRYPMAQTISNAIEA